MPGRVLVVDDSPTIRRVVTSILARRGFTYAEAADGEVALTMLRHGQKFDVVLLDFVMPKKNGYQFCRDLKDTPSSQVPVVLMSAKAEDIRERFLEQTGAVDSIGKPFDAEALIAVIENALRGEVRLSAASLDEERPADTEGSPNADVVSSVNLLDDLLPTKTDEVRADDKLGPPSDDTTMFETPFEVLRQAAKSSKQLPPSPPSTGSISAPSLDELLRARPERPFDESITAADAFFGEDELPFSDRASETTQRIDGMSLIAAKLAEELSGAFGHNQDAIYKELAERLSPRVMRDLLSLFGEIEPGAALSGSLASFSAGSILQFVVAEDATGLLWFRQGEMVVELTLGAGKVDLAHASGGPLEFRLGRYFVAAGLLGQAELDDFLASAPPDSHPRRRPLGERLVAADKISKHSLREVLSLQSSELVYEVLRWNRGKFEFRHGERSELADRAKLGLHTPTLVLDGLRRVESWRHIEANLGDFDDVLAASPGLAGVERELSASERQVLDLADGERTVREIVAASSMSSFDACRILAQFKGAGMIVAKERA